MKKLFFGTMVRTTVVLMLLAALPSLGILLYSGLSTSRQTARTVEAAMLELVSSIARQQYTVVNHTQAMLSTMARIQDIRLGYTERSSRILETLVANSHNYIRMLLVRPEGEVIASSDPLPYPVSPQEILHIRATERTGGFAFSNAVLDRHSGEFIFLCGLPVYAQEKDLRFILLAHVRLDQRGKEFFDVSGVSGRPPLPEASMRVMDSSGKVIYAYPPTDAMFPGMPVPATTLAELQQGSATRGILTVTHHDRPYLVAFEHIRPAHTNTTYLTVLLTLPRDKAFARSSAVLRRNIGFLIPATLLAMLTAVLLVRYALCGPIGQIIGAAQRLADGEASARAGYPKNKGDLGELANSFDDMAVSLQQHSRELAQATTRADAANKSKNEFLATMSHETRTPMNAIIGMAYLAQQSGLNAQQQECVSKIHTAANSLLKVINSTLAPSKAKVDALTINTSRFILDDVFIDTAALAHHLAEGKGLECDAIMDADVPRALIGDAVCLSQVLRNLLATAVTISSYGKIGFHVSLCLKNRKKALLCFAVSAPGSGLPEEQAADLCADDIGAPRRSAPDNDSGQAAAEVGLALAGRLIMHMGGEVRLHRSGQASPDPACPAEHDPSLSGSCMSLLCTLPFDLPAEENSEPSPGAPFSGKRALLVGEHARARTFTRHMLEHFGLEVIEAASGDDALAQGARTAETGNGLDLAVVETGYSGPDGIRLASQVKESLAACNNLPVLLITGFGRIDLVDKAKKIGVDNIIHKPLNVSLMRGTLRHMLPQRTTPQDTRQ